MKRLNVEAVGRERHAAHTWALAHRMRTQEPRQDGSVGHERASASFANRLLCSSVAVRLRGDAARVTGPREGSDLS